MTGLRYSSDEDSANQSVKYYEIMGLDLLSKGDDTDDDASDSSYSSYCNDSLQLSGVPKKTLQQRRSSISDIVNNQSIPANTIQRSPSLTEMISWLSIGYDEYEGDFDLEASTSVAMATHTASKELGGSGKLAHSFSNDILASQSVAGGAGRAA